MYTELKIPCYLISIDLHGTHSELWTEKTVNLPPPNASMYIVAASYKNYKLIEDKKTKTKIFSTFKKTCSSFLTKF